MDKVNLPWFDGRPRAKPNQPNWGGG